MGICARNYETDYVCILKASLGRRRKQYGECHERAGQEAQEIL